MTDRFPGVLIKYRSSNRKLGPVDQVHFDVRNGKKVKLKRARFVPRAPFVMSTYLSIKKSCDDICAFKSGNGCFAESGYSKIMVDGLDAEVKGKMTNLGAVEACAINAAYPQGIPQDGGRDGTKGRDLRLHVSGDAQNEAAAASLASAAKAFRERGGGVVWSYTHSWRRIPAPAWGPIEVLASVETAKDVNYARRRGYVPALVIREFPSQKMFTIPGSDTRFFPCLAETNPKRNCAQCRACFDTKSLYEKNMGVAFAVHGMGATKAKKRLPMFNTLFGTIA